MARQYKIWLKFYSKIPNEHKESDKNIMSYPTSNTQEDNELLND